MSGNLQDEEIMSPLNRMIFALWKFIGKRTGAIGVMVKRELFEVLISPGFYVAVTIGLVIGFFCIAGFVYSIGSSGLDYNALNPFYDIIVKSLTGAFGKTFVDKLFSEGPFLFALIVSFLPVLLFLSITSVFKFGFEKNIGVIELITYGPADGTAYFSASLAKNSILTGFSLIVMFLFFLLAALINNLVLGPTFFFALLLLFFFSLTVYGYVVFISVITNNAASSVAVFITIFIAYVGLQIGSFALVGANVRGIFSAMTWIVRWISPVYYWHFGLDAVDYGNIPGFFLDLVLMLILTFILLMFSHFLLKKRGVRG